MSRLNPMNPTVSLYNCSSLDSKKEEDIYPSYLSLKCKVLEELAVYGRGRRRGGVLQGQHLQRGVHITTTMYIAGAHEHVTIHKLLLPHVRNMVVVCWCVSHRQTFFMPECIWSVRKTYSSLRNA